MEDFDKDKNFYGNKKFVQVALKTTDESFAIQRSSILNTEIEKIWKKLSTNNNFNKDHAFQRAIEIAQAYDFSYKPAKEIAEDDLYRIINRVKAIKEEEIVDSEKVGAFSDSLLVFHLENYGKMMKNLSEVFPQFSEAE